MIVSYHPLIPADRNLLCAGRAPDASDRRAMAGARAIILPQGCRQDLYRMARQQCPHVFPDYTARFAYPGKIGQHRLFMETGAAHPETDAFDSVEDFRRRWPLSHLRSAFPLVFKFNWGGEGSGVGMVASEAALPGRIETAVRFEETGQRGFVLQRRVAAGGRVLRVAVIGDMLVTYWRVANAPNAFPINTDTGRIDPVGLPGLQEAGKAAVAAFCVRTGINLAGFDLLFDLSAEARAKTPLFLEINYFFGRRGLGNAEGFYPLLKRAVDRWRKAIDAPKARNGREATA